jgi:hypothetical protein
MLLLFDFYYLYLNFLSVTEQEIEEGILNEKLEPWKTSFVFIRKFKNIDEIIAKNTELSNKFVDSNEVYRNRLNRIKETLIPSAYKDYKDKNVFQSDEPVSWGSFMLSCAFNLYLTLIFI